MNLSDFFLQKNVVFLLFSVFTVTFCGDIKLHNSTKPGLSNFIANHANNYKGKEAILVTNHSGLDNDFKTNIELLRSSGIVIKNVIAPEHGIYGFQEEYTNLTRQHDPSYDVTVFNLHKLRPDEIRYLLLRHDFVIFDIQDMGMRCYTYITNLKEIIDALEGTKAELIVLDRPNPIAPYGVDGFFLDNNFYSRFVAEFPSPMIYGLTIGEAALFYVGEHNKNVNLKVIPMHNYSKDMIFPDTNMPWIPPSPNLPTYHSSVVYTAIVLFEGVNLSIGRGTTKPFEYIGAPWIEPVELAEILNNLNLENFSFRPVYFEPKFSHHAGRKCGGVHIIYHGGFFRPSEVTFEIMKAMKKRYPQMQYFRFSPKHRLDELAGTDLFRRYIDENRPYSDLKKAMDESNREYLRSVRKYLLY